MTAANGISDLGAYLSGSWSVLRVVTDHRRAECGSFLGWAIFHGAPDGLSYDEAGWLALGNHRGAASQSYRYDLPRPDVAEVRFDDGRPFHRLDLSTGRCQARHLCGADLYDGAFEVLGEYQWRVVWRVTGPHKALVLDSHYLRYDGPPALLAKTSGLPDPFVLDSASVTRSPEPDPGGVSEDP